MSPKEQRRRRTLSLAHFVGNFPLFWCASSLSRRWYQEPPKTGLVKTLLVTEIPFSGAQVQSKDPIPMAEEMGEADMDVDDDSEPEMSQWSSVVPGEETTERPTKQEKEGSRLTSTYLIEC